MQIFYYHSKKEAPKPTSQYRGVSWHTTRKKWKACIFVNDRQRVLGYFDDELKAARCYNDAAMRFGRNVLNILPSPA